MESTWLFFQHGHSLHFKGIDVMNHKHRRTEIPHTRSQVYPLSNLVFLYQKGSASPCSDPQKVNQLTVLLDKFGSKQKVLTQFIFLLNTLAHRKYQIKIPQYNINHNIYAPKQMGQKFRAKSCIFINLFNFTHWPPFRISSK